MQIFAKYYDGRTITLNNIEEDNTILEVKGEIYKKIKGFPPDSLRIILHGKSVEDGNTIKELNKKITPKEILKIRKEFRSKVLARNIYSEVLNIIQPIVIYKLKKKKDKKNRKYLEDALLTSIAGISAAMKNTG